ncbi:MAG: PmoA family protein [Pirellulaceae bacterium]
MPIRLIAILGLAVIVTATAEADEQKASETAKLKIQRDAKTILISKAAAPVLRYRYSDVPRKPYVQELYSPSGIQILRDAPHDHLHHHAMMFAIIGNGVDFWTEGQGHGTQNHVKLGIETVERGGTPSRFNVTHELRWDSHEGKAVLVEERSVSVPARTQGEATLVTWCSSLRPAEGVESVTLTGTHYDGLGLRFIETMDRVGRFLHAAGKEGPLVRGTEHVTPSKWSAYIAPAHGQPVTVAIFDHPDNPRHPAGMFTMTAPFAYLSATPNVWKQPLVLSQGDQIRYRYGVAVWDGETSPEAIEALYRRWLGP